MHLSKSHTVPLDVNKFAVAFFAVLSDERDPDDKDDMVEGAIELVAPLFEYNTNEIKSFIARLGALVVNLENPELSEFVSIAQDRTRVHPCLLHAASQMALNSNGRFPRKKLELSARKFQRESYSDWSWNRDQ